MTLEIKTWIQGKHLPSSSCAQFLQIASHSIVGVWEVAHENKGRKDKIRSTYI